MEYSTEFKTEYHIAIPYNINMLLKNHLIRDDEQEDLVFCLWYPSVGTERYTALIHEIIKPDKGDRNIHGNVSFNYKYFKRVCEIALEKKCGIAFLHSHPGAGWQGMSFDDIAAENKMAPTVDTITNLPLIGLTVSNDGIWSGRFWYYTKNKFVRKWVKSIKIVGEEFSIFFDEKQVVPFQHNDYLLRTVSIWGQEKQEMLQNLKIGIVGLGSVGSIVAETLSRMGITDFVLIDFDKIEKHNLDRLVGVSKKDIGKYKVDVIKKSMQKSSPHKKIRISAINKNVSEKDAYKYALDCDFIFCCADKPRARYILNHIAYAHLIPVVNGGILAEVKKDILQFADWELSLITPSRPCMQCIEAYTSSDVMLEIEGKLEDPEYIKGLSDDANYKQNQNVMPFSMNLASFEVLQFVAYVTATANIEYYGIQRYRYKQAIISNYLDKTCKNGCDFIKNIATGDSLFKPI